MKRNDFIDTLRGLAIISMIAFHTCWMLNHFGLAISNEALFGTAFLVWERSICISFIAISGFSFSFGRSHLRSGLIVFGAGLIIMLVTCLFLPDMRIVFGILTFLGSAMLLMIFPDRKLSKISSRNVSVLLFCVSLFLFVLCYNINKGYLGIYPNMAIILPKSLYKGYLAAYIGFMEPGFASVDYFSILPWIFIYLCGYFLHKIVKDTNAYVQTAKLRIPGINVLGRHSLAIYLIHPIILYVGLYLTVSLGLI